MNRLVILINLMLITSMQLAIAQVNNLGMSDLREINFQVVKLIGDYESFSAFSSDEDYSGFSNLFTSDDAFVYCDVLYDSRLDDKVRLNEYIDIVRSNYKDASTLVRITKINLPSFTANTGTTEVEITKTVDGLNKCNNKYNDLYNLVVTISFQFTGGIFEDFKISDISSKKPRGKLIVLRAVDLKGKVIPNESFLINNRVFTTDINGNINYHFMNQDSSLLISVPINSTFNETVRYNNYMDLVAHSKKASSPCEPGVVEFTVKKTEVLATTTKAKNKETKKEKLERENYEKAVAEAQILLTDKKFLEARASYLSALKIRPGDKACQEKINEIDTSLNEIKTLNERYTKAIAEGDAYFKTAKYAEALESYQRANKIKPEEKYPPGQVEKINGIFAELKKKGENYEASIAKADSLLADKRYSEAKTSYQSALKYRPEELYPQQKIKEIDLDLAEIKGRDDSYNKAVAEGDYYYNAAKYLEAVEPYKRASNIKPKEKYPLEQIEKINGIIAATKRKEGNYTSLIAEADKLLESKKYPEAKISYQSALRLKPNEKYPQQKISEIDLALSGIKARDSNYYKAVSEGDDFFNAAKYREAFEPYNRASNIKPEEKYPLEQIKKINGIIAGLKAKEDNYASQIVKADKLMEEKKYTDALTSYKKALAIKPDEIYPQEKIITIQSLLAVTTDVNEQYTQAISDGNAALIEKEFDKAVANYRIALQLKPEALFLNEKIAKAETEIKRLNDNYTAAIDEGDNRFGAKQYQPALEAYKQALNIKPGEKYPLERIEDIKGIIEQIKITQEQYDRALSEGDVSFLAKDYEKALAYYKAALQFKPEEQLPKDKIAHTEDEFKKINESYAASIAEGDEMYNSKKYPDAITAYQKSLEIKPSEKYPADQIALIQAIINKQNAAEFPVGIVLNYILPSVPGPVIKKSDLVQNKVKPVFSLGYGITAGYKFKLGRLGKFQLRTGFTVDNINFNSDILQYPSHADTIDPDGYQYTRTIQVNNLTEGIKLSYYSVPLALEKIFSLGQSGWALSLNAGVNLMFLNSARYESTANISYSGYYPKLFNLTIRDLEEYEFGTYPISTSNSIKAKSSIMSMDFGAGLSKRIRNISLFAECRYRTSNTNMFETKNLWSLSQQFKEIESTMNFKNKYNLSYCFLSVGLVFNF